MNWTFGLQKRSSVGAHFCKLQEILWLSTYTSFNYFPLVNFSEHQEISTIWIARASLNTLCPELVWHLAGADVFVYVTP
jgi:hypothetical protein